MAFRGNFEHSLDAKNRLSIPSRFRASLADGLVIGPWLDTCVAVFTPEDFEAFTAQLTPDMHPLSPKRRKLEAFFAQNYFDADLDSAGRITLGAALIKHAGITKEIVVGGTGNRLEIWDRDAWGGNQEGVVAELNEIAQGLDHAS